MPGSDLSFDLRINNQDGAGNHQSDELEVPDNIMLHLPPPYSPEQAGLLARWPRSRAWCRTNRHRPAREQRAWLSAALNGHYAYYGITGNIRRLQEYRHQIVRIWHKWLERRTRGRTFTWDNFNAFLTRHPLPAAKIIHRYT